MAETLTQYTRRYLAQRRDVRSAFGYGLGRRTRMLLEAVDAAFAPDEPASIRVVDFGCAEGAMMEALAEALGPRFGWGIGLDVFRAGRPEDQADRRVYFVTADLFREFPYPVDAACADVAILSAFAKHHPDPPRLLAEVARILRPGGIAVLLDPIPSVVRVGVRIGRFNPTYNPSPWSRGSVARLLRDHRDLAGLRIDAYRRYWLAPNHAIHRTGVESLLPGPLARRVGLHQCLVLRRV